MYTSTPIEDDFVKESFLSEKIISQYEDFEIKQTNQENIVPDLTEMPAMDAISLLENFGLKVKVNGVGKVKKQSIKKGTPIKKGTTIILNLS